MQAYMKSEMPFLGVQTPGVLAVCRQAFSDARLKTFGEWRDTVLELWRSAQYREERYAAIRLTGDKSYASFQTLQALAIYEEMIVSGAWWDVVDPIATQRLGGLLSLYPEQMNAAMREWAVDGDPWKRRAAILCQLKFKQDTDLDLLYTCILHSMRDKGFFLRKAIGWALREYAKADAEEVVRFIQKHENTLSALSKREALRNVL